jgi:hypothetical protein
MKTERLLTHCFLFFSALFAPTEEAFAGIDNIGDIDDDRLTKILSHHVVSGKFVAGDLTDGQTLNTFAMEPLTVRVVEENDEITIFINDAEVVLADIEGSNGVIHGIDKVLMPQAEPTPAPVEDASNPPHSTDLSSAEESDDEDSSASTLTGGWLVSAMLPPILLISLRL